MLNKIISSSFYNLYSSLSKFLIFILIARLLSKNDFGLYSFYISLFSLSSLLIIFGFHRSIFKFNYISILGIFLKVSLVFFTLFILIFEVVQTLSYSDIISSVKGHNYITFYVLVMSIFTVFFAYFRVISLINIENIATKLLYPTLLLLILGMTYFCSCNIYYYHIFLVDMSIMLLVLIWVLLVHKNKFLGLFKKTINSTNEILKYSFKIFLSNVFTRATFLFDILFIGILMTPQDVAEYSVALKLTLGVTIIVSAFIQVLEKSMAHSENITNNLKDIIGLLFLITIMVTLSILLFFNELITLFGEDYSGIKLILIILLISKIFDGIFSLYGVMLFYKQKENIMIKVSAYSFIISFLLNYLMITYFGLTGAALASLISIFIFGIFTYKMFNEEYKINFFKDNKMFFYSAVFGVSSLILIEFLNIASFSFSIKILLCTIIFILIYFIAHSSINKIRSMNE